MNRWLQRMTQVRDEQIQGQVSARSGETKPSNDLSRLRALYLAGRLKGMKLALPGFYTEDLERHLARSYGRTVSEADHKRLEKIAVFVCRLPFLEVN